jgi:arylsulfatase A-like enzyme
MNSYRIKFILNILSLILYLISVAQSNRTKSKLPHVITVVIDDAGVADTGFSSRIFNNEDASPILTPFIDSLADESIKLTNYYTHPTCTPSRISLMTGTYAYMHGLPFAITGNSGANPPIGIDPDILTLGQMFSSAGYKTHLVGKWHLGHSREIMQPPRRGFNSFYGLMGGAFDHYKKTSGQCLDLWYYDDETMKSSKKMIRVPISEVDVTEHATKLFARKAIDVINNHPNDENLFLYLAFTAPHDPLQADQEFIEKCNHISNPSRKIFCGMMLQLDYELSKVVDSLKKKNMWEDTVLVFTTDNGGMPIVGGYNYPFRGMKSDSWEGGVRGPAFVRIPSFYYNNEFNLNKKEFCFHGLIHISDWLPTLKGLLKSQGATFDESLYKDLTGIDQSSALTGHGAKKFLVNDQTCYNIYQKEKHQTEYLNSNEYPRKSLIPQADIFMNALALRKGCYKIIIGRPGGNNVINEGKTFFNVDGKQNEKESKLITSLNTILYEYGLSNSIKLIDYATEKKFLPVNTDMFYKCGVQTFIDILIDWFQENKYSSLSPSHKYIEYLNDQNKQLFTEGKLKNTPKNEGVFDFVFTGGTTNKYQNNPPSLNEPNYSTVLFYNICEDPSEINNLSKMKEKAEELNEMYKILLEETQKAPPQFAGDAASKLAGQKITILRDDGSLLNIDLPGKKSPDKDDSHNCDLSHMPFVPDDLTITELAQIYNKGDFFRTLPEIAKKLLPFL